MSESVPCLLWYIFIFITGWQVTKRAILASRVSFIQAGLKGNDMGRANRPEVSFIVKTL